MCAVYLTIFSKGDVFPELTKRVDEVKEILDEEEESFSRTLDRGEKLFEQYVSRTQQSGEKKLSGKDVWRLYDTYGFPVDLTRLMADELGLTVDEAEFEQAQADSKEASKAKKKSNKETVKLDVHDIAALEKNPDVPKTDDSAKFCECISTDMSRALVLKYRQPWAISNRGSSQYTTTGRSCKQLRKSPMTHCLVSSWTRQASMQNLVVKSTIPVVL